MYLSIAIKLLVGMLGVIFFLRISGKTQMAQLTPLDSVNSFVLGALVGGVIYNPDTPVWYLVFAFAVWTAANVSLRYLMRFHRIRRAIKGDSVMLVRDRRLVMREFRRNGLEMEQFRTMLREVDTGTRILYRPAGGTRRPGCGKGDAFGRLRTEQPETVFRTTPGNAPGTTRAKGRDRTKAGARHPTGLSRICGQIKKGRPKSRPFSIPGAHRYLPTVCTSARK